MTPEQRKAVERPDPNGCRVCGRLACPRLSLGTALADARAAREAWCEANPHGYFHSPEYVALDEKCAKEGKRSYAAIKDCNAHRVDWQAECRALLALVREPVASVEGASPRTPPPEVLRAAERIGELAAKCDPGPWSTKGDGKPPDPSPIMVCQPPLPDSLLERGYPVAHCYGRPHNTHNAAFIAECRTLAVVLAEWVKGEGDEPHDR